MGFIFRWNPTKARKNINKHDVTFEEASTVFRDPLSLTINDEDHSDDEDRLIILGGVSPATALSCCAYR